MHGEPERAQLAAGIAIRLARFQTRWHVWLALVAAVATGTSYLGIRELQLKTAWEELLPTDKPSVRDMEQARGRVKGLTTLTIAVRSRDGDALLRFGRDLSLRLERELVGEGAATAIDWRIDAYEQFVERNRYLFASVEDLRTVRDAVRARLEWERQRRSPFYIDLGEEAPEDPRDVIERLQKRRRDESAGSRVARFPGGMFVNRERTLLAIFVRTDMRASDVTRTSRLMASVEEQIAALRPTRYHPSITTELTGEVLTAREEHDALRDELLLATVLTTAISLGAIFVFFRRLRTIPLLGLGIALPAALTFVFARFAVGQLNTSTAFLGSIIIGNGINPGIMWLARYVEERAAGADVETAFSTTHRETWRGTIAASLAAGLAYGSLMITDFRGFRDFGVIGGVGMVLCWTLTYAFLPAWVALFERIRAMKTGQGTRSALFTKLAGVSRRAPRTVLGITVTLALLGAGAAVFAVTMRDPIEYGFGKLRSERETTSRAGKTNREIGEFVGQAERGNFIVMMLDRREHVPIALARLAKLRNGPDGARFGRIRSIEDLLPTEQAPKVEILREIRRLMLDAREHASDAQRARIDEQLPAEDMRPLTDADLPEQVARRFTERGGERGRIILVEPAKGKSIWNGRYLVEWTGAMRQLRLPDGSKPLIIGRGPVFADMIESIWIDGPKAVAASFGLVLVLVVFSFRRMRYRLISMGTLLVGVAWMTGTLVLLEALRQWGVLDTGVSTKLNFLNFVALPITFGIGVDYATNVVSRFASEVESGGLDPVGSAAQETGGAVVLCSCTTVAGYSSLFTSANRALQSFGLAATLGELATMLAAQVVLPAILVLVLARIQKRIEPRSPPIGSR